MWPNPQEATDLVTFTEEILNGKLHFLSSEILVMTTGHYKYLLLLEPECYLEYEKSDN